VQEKRFMRFLNYPLLIIPGNQGKMVEEAKIKKKNNPKNYFKVYFYVKV